MPDVVSVRITDVVSVRMPDVEHLYATTLASPRKHPVDDPTPVTPNPIAPVDEPKKPEPPVGEPDEEEEPDT